MWHERSKKKKKMIDTFFRYINYYIFAVYTVVRFIYILVCLNRHLMNKAFMLGLFIRNGVLLL